MSVSGKYVRTFAEASHALPEGMHMNADYPFMIPPVRSTDGRTVTLAGEGGRTETVPIKRAKGREYCELAQSSTFERLYRRRPTTFKFHPFKDERTPAVGSSEPGLFDEARKS